jgi:hypothetical protein
MPDVMKMDELLAVHHQGAVREMRPAGRSPRDAGVMKWAIIGLGTLFYGVPALAMVGYAFWVAMHFNK